MKKILIAESVDESILDQISKHPAFEVTYNPTITSQDIASIIETYHALVVRPKVVTPETIYNGKNLQCIIRGGAGVNSIDVDTATQHGIAVLNTPGQNSDATAEFAFACILELVAQRPLLKASIDVRAGEATAPDDYTANELHGKSLAIIGFGNTGKRLARVAHAFDMQVFAYSRSLTKTEANTHNVTYCPSLTELLEHQADIISLHTPLTDKTEHMINAQAFDCMKQGSILINTARPALVESAAFANALKNGTIARFAIDGDPDPITPFIEADPEQKGLITHHIADATHEAMANITNAIFNQLDAFFNKGKVVNCVNPAYEEHC